MEERCIEKLKEWFGNSLIDYEIMKSTDFECIFLVITEDHAGRTISSKISAGYPSLYRRGMNADFLLTVSITSYIIK